MRAAVDPEAPGRRVGPHNLRWIHLIWYRDVLCISNCATADYYIPRWTRPGDNVIKWVCLLRWSTHIRAVVRRVKRCCCCPGCRRFPAPFVPSRYNIGRTSFDIGKDEALISADSKFRSTFFFLIFFARLYKSIHHDSPYSAVKEQGWRGEQIPKLEPVGCVEGKERWAGSHRRTIAVRDANSFCGMRLIIQVYRLRPNPLSPLPKPIRRTFGAWLGSLCQLKGTSSIETLDWKAGNKKKRRKSWLLIRNQSSLIHRAICT